MAQKKPVDTLIRERIALLEGKVSGYKTDPADDISLDRKMMLEKETEELNIRIAELKRLQREMAEN